MRAPHLRSRPKTEAPNGPAGFSLIQILIAVLVLTLAGLSVIGMFEFALKVVVENKLRTGGIMVANEAIETVRNLPYGAVGTVGGVVSGAMPQEDAVLLNGMTYGVSTSVIYVDDPFDGLVSLGNDSLGNDYKKVRVAVSWQGRFGPRELVAVATVAPRGIETNEGGGALKLNVIDSGGAPVPQANVHIINQQTTPTIDDDTMLTGDDGSFLSAVPASNDSYQIVVTKTGYSSDYNCAIDPVGSGCSTTEGNQNPVKPLATVLEGQLTELTFIIDRVATLTIETVSQNSIPAEWVVNTDASGEDQQAPALVLGSAGQYYFAWQDFRSSAARIYGQHDIGPTAQWSPDLAITTSNNQAGPDVAADRNGNLYVVWHDDRNGNQDVYLNAYDASGAERWLGAKKINTDASSADQVYPRIVPSASTTAALLYVAWKDNRAGGGDSDIYLQKFDQNGTAQWGSEVKVNFTSSSVFQVQDSTSWTFSSAAEYVCDGGSCSGTTDVEVAEGVARLVAVKSCQGTSTACSSLLTQPTCTGQSGCSWDASGPCENGSCLCSAADDQATCTQVNGCSWQAGVEGCSGGSCDCWSINGRSRCQSVPGCGWFVFFCYPTSGCSCTTIGTEATCEDAQCGWGPSGGNCTGSCSCSTVATEPSCAEVSCSWDQGGPCSGTPAACDTFADQSSCQAQQGCGWTQSGSSYPARGPGGSSIQLLGGSCLISWDGFSEDAVKNGGEIYYQLSDNDGSSWKYWNGSTWQTTAGSYTTAVDVASHLGAFPTTQGKLLFRAFLDGDGSQQMSLDSVTVDYTRTIEGGDASQAVDLAVDANDNMYVVWETDDGTGNYDVFLQKVDSNGAVIWPSDVRVNTTSSGNQMNPAVVVDAAGNAVVVWQDSRDGDDRIYAHKFGADGAAMWPTDVPVSVGSGADQQQPAIALAQNGNDAVVAWQDFRNGSNDIYLQKLKPNGAPVWGADIRVNAEANGDQRNPAVITSASGNPVVSWQDNQTGEYDIRAAEYNGDPSSTSPIPNVPLTVTGSKKVGNNPVIYKYNQNVSTNGSGVLTLSTLEWDTYMITLQGGTGYTLYSAEPPLPFLLNPAQTLTVTLTLE